jgi:hypothetical protein
MTRQTFWLAFGAIVLAVLGGAWFVSHFDRVPVTEREPPQAEARRNPYLALERFLARFDRRLEIVSETAALDRPAAGGVLILDDDRRRLMSPQRVERLLGWVAAGGYLIVNPERGAAGDPVLATLGVGWREAGSMECGPGTAGPKGQRLPETVEVQLPGNPRPLRIFHPGRALQSQEEPAWQAEVPGTGAALLHFRYDAGQITVLANFGVLADNEGIGAHDHAELILALIERYGGSGPLRLATRLSTPSLFDWLVHEGWALLASAALLLAAWLWRIVPRFGPPAPAPVAERRGLAEHLAAVGRQVWRSGGLEHWLAVARQALQSRLARRHPGIAAAAPVDQVQALARLAGLPAEEVRFALGGRVASARDYAEAVRLLQHIERTL